MNACRLTFPVSKWPLILVYKGLYLVLPHLLGWPPHCCLDWPSRSEGAMLEDSEAKEKRDCLSGAAWDSVQGEVVVMLRAESLLCLRPLSALRPEPCRKVTCFPSVNPLGGQGHGRGCLASCFGTAWSLHRCWSPALPHPQRAAGCQNVALPQPPPGLSRDPISPSPALRRLCTVVSLPCSPSGQPAQPPGARHPEHLVSLFSKDVDFSHIHMVPTLGLLIISLKLRSLSWACCLPHIRPSQCIPASISALVLSSRPDPPFPRLPYLSKYQRYPEMWGTSLPHILPHVTH